MTSFGTFVRTTREQLQAAGSVEHSLRKVAARLGVTPAYLSKIEHDDGSPPTEKTILALAQDLQIDPNIMLAVAGKVSSELQAIICQRPQLFADMLVACRDMPDHAIVRIVREVRDGDW